MVSSFALIYVKTNSEIYCLEFNLYLVSGAVWLLDPDLLEAFNLHTSALSNSEKLIILNTNINIISI